MPEMWIVTFETTVTGIDALTTLLKNTTGNVVDISKLEDEGKPTPAANSEPIEDYGSRNADTYKRKLSIINSVKNGRGELGQMRVDFKKNGHSPKLFDQTLAALRNGKHLVGTERGHYRLANGAA